MGRGEGVGADQKVVGWWRGCWSGEIRWKCSLVRPGEVCVSSLMVRKERICVATLAREFITAPVPRARYVRRPDDRWINDGLHMCSVRRSLDVLTTEVRSTDYALPSTVPPRGGGVGRCDRRTGVVESIEP